MARQFKAGVKQMSGFSKGAKFVQGGSVSPGSTPTNPSPWSHLHISSSLLGQIKGIWLDWILPSYQGAGDWLTYQARHLRIKNKKINWFNVGQ